MNTVPLGEVTNFVRGVTFKPADLVEMSKTSIDCYRTKNVQTSLVRSDVLSLPASHVGNDGQLLRHGDVLISSANSWNLVGKCCWIPELERPSTFGGFVTVLRANEKRLESRYLYRWFASARVQETVRSFGNRTTSISNLNLRRTAKLPIPIPPLAEQNRISNILDKADALRAKRREAIARLDSLSQSIFHEMFGDPAANDRDWSTRDLGVVLRSIDSGSSPVCSSRPAHGNECGLLKLGAITTGTWKPGENKAFTDAAPNVRNEVRAGDVLFSRKNTPSLVAAVARVDEVPQRLFLPDLIFRLCIRDQEQMLPEFLTALLQYPTQKRAIQRLATGSAQSMVNISKAKLLGIPVVVPPLELQQQFSNRMAAVERLKAKYRVQLAELDNLFLSLQDRAFKGEL